MAFRSIMSVRGRLFTGFLGLSLLSTSAIAGPNRQKAYDLHNRLAGVPPSSTVLDDMEKKLDSNDFKGAAQLATANKSFLEIVVRNFAAVMTNVDQSAKVPLNDMIATIIGAVRDNLPYSSLLWDDILYVGTGTVAGGDPAPTGTNVYSPANNNHYVEVERLGDLDQRLVKVSQKSMTGIEPAGLYTTRGWGEAFLKDGTNRRSYRFTHVNFFCADLEDRMDTQLPESRIRKDVDRVPGGDSKLFHDKCMGCHTHMDGNTGAFAYYDYNATTGRVVYTPDVVAAKYLIHSDTYEDGYNTVDDSWINFLPKGLNASMGFKGVDAKGEIRGKGLVDFGKMIGSADEFARCAVKRAWASVCLARPRFSDSEKVESLAKGFAGDNYNLKNLFVSTAEVCLQ